MRPAAPPASGPRRVRCSEVPYRPAYRNGRAPRRRPPAPASATAGRQPNVCPARYAASDRDEAYQSPYNAAAPSSGNGRPAAVRRTRPRCAAAVASTRRFPARDTGRRCPSAGPPPPDGNRFPSYRCPWRPPAAPASRPRIRPGSAPARPSGPARAPSTDNPPVFSAPPSSVSPASPAAKAPFAGRRCTPP